MEILPPRVVALLIERPALTALPLGRRTLGVEAPRL
jgi:hypothetical protein